MTSPLAMNVIVTKAFKNSTKEMMGDGKIKEERKKTDEKLTPIFAS